MYKTSPVASMALYGLLMFILIVFLVKGELTKSFEEFESIATINFTSFHENFVYWVKMEKFVMYFHHKAFFDKLRRTIDEKLFSSVNQISQYFLLGWLFVLLQKICFNRKLFQPLIISGNYENG